VEQIYSFIDSSQDFREGTPMRLLNIRVSKLLQLPRNSLIIIPTTSNRPYHSITLHSFLGATWHFRPLHCKPSMMLYPVIT